MSDEKQSTVSDKELENIAGGAIDDSALDSIAGGAMSDDELGGVAGGVKLPTDDT